MQCQWCQIPKWIAFETAGRCGVIWTMTCCSDVTLGAINSAPCHINRLRLFGTSTAEKTAVMQYVNCTCRRNSVPDRSSPFAVQQFWYYHQYSCGAAWPECAALEVNSTILISRSARGFQFNFPPVRCKCRTELPGIDQQSPSKFSALLSFGHHLPNFSCSTLKFGNNTWQMSHSVCFLLRAHIIRVTMFAILSFYPSYYSSRCGK